jgi:hypothetical protein
LIDISNPGITNEPTDSDAEAEIELTLTEDSIEVREESTLVEDNPGLYSYVI